jgi:phosphate starvation-inducible protein PhoH
MSRRNTSKQRKQDTNVVLLSEALFNNGAAISSGPRKKRWTLHDLKRITPLSDAQRHVVNEFNDGQHICMHGSAGTGKTYLMCYLALNEYLQHSQKYDKIIIVRSVVPTRDIGFLPGTVEEKTAVYEQPYKDIFADLLGRSSSYDDMKDEHIVEFNITSFVRGLTWDNALIVVDEIQNMSWSEFDSVITRVGQNSRVLLCGDTTHQMDLTKERTGIINAIRILDNLSHFSVKKCSVDDIVRSEFVKQWILAREDLKL